MPQECETNFTVLSPKKATFTYLGTGVLNYFSCSTAVTSRAQVTLQPVPEKYSYSMRRIFLPV
jgi:hypothetical protein